MLRAGRHNTVMDLHGLNFTPPKVIMYPYTSLHTSERAQDNFDSIRMYKRFNVNGVLTIQYAR